MGNNGDGGSAEVTEYVPFSFSAQPRCSRAFERRLVDTFRRGIQIPTYVENVSLGVSRQCPSSQSSMLMSVILFIVRLLKTLSQQHESRQHHLPSLLALPLCSMLTCCVSCASPSPLSPATGACSVDCCDRCLLTWLFLP
jgi:hypothetical protein